MYHCHMLSHEDEGMMGQFIVIDNMTATNNLVDGSISIYPNPTSSIIRIDELKPSIIEIYNTSGKLLERRETTSEREQFNLDDLASGVYYFKIISLERNEVYKVVKKVSRE